MTKLNKYIKEIDERCAAATDGTWYSFAGVLQDRNGLTGVTKGDDNSNFIAHSRTDVEVLLKMLKLTIKDRKTFIDFYNEIAETIGGKKLKPLDLDFIVPEREGE